MAHVSAAVLSGSDVGHLPQHGRFPRFFGWGLQRNYVKTVVQITTSDGEVKRVPLAFFEDEYYQVNSLELTPEEWQAVQKAARENSRFTL